ncbi:hypothetical protein GOV13_05275 [Candidatus Pacearchaeota archaeon]|nr:hypothetical protein [Candidatus Pacearchaeota archaeon]
MKKLIINLMFVLALSVVIASGLTIPVKYTGNLIYDGIVVNGDFNVTAFIGDNIMSSGTASGGVYEVDVSSCCGVGSGTIDFFVNGIEANEHPAYNGEEDYGKVTEMNLTFDEEIPQTSSCGDEEVNPGEQCDGSNINFATCANVVGTGWTGTVSCTNSCAFDISGCSFTGIVNPPSSSGSSSSSSSGSSSSSSGGPYSPSTANTPLTNSDPTPNENPLIGLDSGKEPSSAGITGAATGILSSSGGIALLFVVLILVLGIAVMIIQKRGKSLIKTPPQNL